ncbi:MAG: NAD-dependent epimerase/dehydratase family protein [Bacteroidota bacterium]|nr:NAD-dependent epimerase/dehydratase family protein [Bacteroidota bacterium]
MVKKEKCLVFGGGGFIGSHLCDELLSKDYEVTIFDKINFSKKNITHLINKIKIIEGDFNNEIDLSGSLKDIDYVFHLVSSTLPATSNENPVYDAETNLISSLKLFKECSEIKIKKIIFVSSGGTVYGVPDKIPIRENYNSNPICSYGIIKKTIEEYLFIFEKIYGLDYYIFRLSNPYGARQNPLAAQGVISVFINKVINNDKITIWGDGKVIRDYIYIKDVVKVLVDSLSKDSQEKIFNLSSGKGHSLNEIIKLIKKVSGKEIRVENKVGRSIDVPVNVLDNTLIKKIFNWKPKTTIEEGISLTYNYLNKINER